jgi:hypothetical protein
MINTSGTRSYTVHPTTGARLFSLIRSAAPLFIAAAELRSTTQMQKRELMARIDIVQQELSRRQRLQATADNLERSLRDENERLMRDNKDMQSEMMVRASSN